MIGLKLSEYEKFFRDGGYTLLADTVETVIRHIDFLYIQSGSPLGDGEALTWADGEYNRWKQAKEMSEPEIQEQVQKAMLEAEALGDVTPQEAGFLLTSKAIARNLVLVLSLIINVADDESRGLTTTETFTLEYQLVTSLAHLRSLRSYEKQP